MKVRVYECLAKLREQYGPRESGKLFQKLLAIAFSSAGCRDIVERGVQGVDVDLRWASGQKQSIEVKTTGGPTVHVGRKDIEALAQRVRQDGYQPLLGVLRIHVFHEWNFARGDRLRPGVVAIERLRPYRLRDLETFIEPHFDGAVCAHCQGALDGAQAYLDDVLRQRGVCVDDGPSGWPSPRPRVGAASAGHGRAVFAG